MRRSLNSWSLPTNNQMQHTTTKYEAEVNALSLQLENAR